ncbi:hypothetical protein [Streptomyces anulatus]|uniref:hypothetical protein n=1 Tax=Streptomyces anulatus TaxID=1892 RepID=UPI0033C466C5
MTRIAVLGPPGAGKSTLTARLGTLTGLPAHDLDDLYWRPGWRRPAPDAWERIQQDLAAGPQWLIAGNYQQTAAIRISRADVVVILDPGPVTCLRRLLVRTLRIHLGATELLPAAMRASGRSRAHHGLLRIARIAWRYRQDCLPRTRCLARRHEVRVIVLRKHTAPGSVLQMIDRELQRRRAPAQQGHAQESEQP